MKGKNVVEIVQVRDNNDIEYRVGNNTDKIMNGLKWCILFFVLAFLPVFLPSISPKTEAVLTGSFAIVGVGIFVLLYKRSTSLDKAEAALVVEAIQDTVLQDAKKRNVKVRRIKFCSDFLDSYGSIDEEYVLALLSDKTVLKYPIEQLDNDDKQFHHKLIKAVGTVCNDNKQVKHIYRESVLSKVIRSRFFTNLASWGIIVGILAIGVLTISLLLLPLFKYPNEKRGVGIFALLITGLFASLFAYIYVDKKLPKNNLSCIIRFVLLLPIMVLLLSKPFVTIVLAFMLMVGYSLLPVLFVEKVTELCGYEITASAELFINLTVPLILATYCSTFILHHVILRFSTFANNDHHYQLFMRELVKFIYTKENLSFIIYAGYFIFIAVSSFHNLQTGQALWNNALDLVVTKSFLVYMACTSMLDRQKSSNIGSSALLHIIIQMLDASDDEEWRKKRKVHLLG